MDAIVLFLLSICLAVVADVALPASLQLGDPCSRTDGTDIGEPFVQYTDEDTTVKTVSLSSISGRQRRAATAYRGLLWVNATVVFSIGVEYKDGEAEVILDAMREWEELTCVRFRRRTVEESYIHFFKGIGCCSFVGHLNFGRQPISLPNSCLHHSIVLHELGHVIGYWHEQSRPDRDKYVRALLQNVKPSQARNFWKKYAHEVDSLGVAYDFNSIMHYSGRAFQRFSGSHTLESVEPGIPLGNALQLSTLDILQTNLLYRCGTLSPPKLIPPRNTTPTTPPSSTHVPRLPLTSTASCHYRLSSLMGAFSSPGYPGRYGAGLNCSWSISAPRGHFISLMLQPLALDFANPCRDYIELHEGPLTSSPVVKRLCGHFVRFLLQTLANTALLVFRTDSHSSQHLDTGFRAVYAAIDLDECVSDDVCSHTCINIPGSYVCTCRRGYYLSSDGRFCHDQNECGVENGYCSHSCVNTAGSYYCGCPSGYRISRDLHICHPVGLPLVLSPCSAGNGGCEQVCSVSGDHSRYALQCSCRPGNQLDRNGRNCSDLNECAVFRGACHPGECVNTVGSYSCVCPPGYTTTTSQTPGCREIDECQADRPCDHSCHNTHGSFYCTCDSGYSLSQDGKKCTDIDECTEEMHSCDQVCINLNGSYTCACRSGYRLNQGNCEDVDECATLSPCAHVCTNTESSFLCGCLEGFLLDQGGTNCSDIDECSSDNGGCDDVCVNTAGSYHCQCSTGLHLSADGHSCTSSFGGTPQSACVSGKHGCPPSCNASQCWCALGHRLSQSGRVCIDIDECAVRPGVCEHTCNNTEGSHVCSCGEEFLLALDGHHCVLRSCEALNGGCQHECFTDVFNNTRCKCRDGFIISTDEKACLDRSPSTSPQSCHFPCSHSCPLVAARRVCTCALGYRLARDGVTCTDINECQFSNGGCSQECSNRDGAYSCACREGFELGGDLRTCEDVNECAFGHTCTWSCVNTIGSYKCLCPNGFRLGSDGGCTPRCGGFVHSSSGTVTTPWYPILYQRRLDCWWFIRVPNHYAVDLFLSMDVDDTQRCSGDAVEVLNGLEWDAPSMGKHCGSRQISVTTSTSAAVVHFKSDNVQMGVRQGLRLTYSIGSPAGHFSCGSVNILRDGAYVFGPSTFPSTITQPLHCSWLLFNIQHPAKMAKIEFLYFDIGSTRDRLSQPSDSAACTRDYVTIGSSPSDVQYRLCSPRDVRSLVVTDRLFGVWLHVESANRFKGIHARISLHNDN